MSIDLSVFTEIPLNDRVRKLELGQIILIDQETAFKLQVPLQRNDLKARDPRLSRTLYPPLGAPMFKKDAELEKWLREVQKSGRRITTETPQASTQGKNGHNHSG